MSTNRTALVTGASRGIGRTIATTLAARGHQVMAVARSEESLHTLGSDHGIEFVVASVATEVECQRVVDETRERLGPIDILVNNAGVSPPRAAVWEEDPTVWRQTMAVNLEAAFHLMRFASKEMIEREWGRIVTVGSTAGLVGSALEATYDTSKHALVGLTRAVAQDVGSHGVTCNIVLPGSVETDMLAQSVSILAERRGVNQAVIWSELATLNPAGRFVTTEEVAAVIAFLASDDASAVNGEAIRVALGAIT